MKIEGRPALAAALEAHDRAIAGHAEIERDRQSRLSAMLHANPDPDIRHHAVATIGGVPHYFYRDHKHGFDGVVKYSPVSAGVPTKSSPSSKISTQYGQEGPILDAALRFDRASAAGLSVEKMQQSTDRAARKRADTAAETARVEELRERARSTGQPQVESSWEQEVNESDNSMNIVTRYVRADGSTYTTTTKTY